MNWFKLNTFIVNSENILGETIEQNKHLDFLKLYTLDKAIKSLSSVELPGIIMNDKLNFNFHIGNSYRFAANQGNAQTRLNPLFNSYILLNLIIALLYGCSPAANL